MDVAVLSDVDLTQQIGYLRHEQLRRAGKTHACARCGTAFCARAGARYCSGRCRVAACRARQLDKSRLRGAK